MTFIADPYTRTVSLGKFGSFPSNALLGRPYYCTYEILEDNFEDECPLRIVSAAELHVAALTADASTPSEPDDIDLPATAQDIDAIIRNNQLTVDDPSRQALSMSEIEELKTSSSSRKLIEKLLSSHSAISEKTAFSLAKYTNRKQRKYLKRFTVLPVDVSFLVTWYLHEKEAPKILELREETLGLIASCSNVQCGQGSLPDSVTGRWLVVDDTAGMLVAALAERMGILYPSEPLNESRPAQSPVQMDEGNKPTNNGNHPTLKRRRPHPDTSPSNSNSITLVHSATQPNLSMLAYFSYDPNCSSGNSSTPAESHPLHHRLKTLTWLQLLSPEDDVAYAEPEVFSDEALAALKSGKRGAYHRKRRRWQRLKSIVDETRTGSFDGLVVASTIHTTDVLHHLAPLLRSGAPVVVYNPYLEPLAETLDAYSSGRRAAYISATEAGKEPAIPSEDFPADPRLLLGPSLQTAQAEEWQVLPGRTHPLMTTRGGAEGYLFTATRVSPATGSVKAHGNFIKKRKTAEQTNGTLDVERSEIR